MCSELKKLNPAERFGLFCLENYRIKKQIPGNEALNDFKQTGVFQFLEEGYEVLHTQSTAYIVSEIIQFIDQHKA